MAAKRGRQSHNKRPLKLGCREWRQQGGSILTARGAMRIRSARMQKNGSLERPLLEIRKLQADERLDGPGRRRRTVRWQASSDGGLGGGPLYFSSC